MNPKENRFGHAGHSFKCSGKTQGKFRKYNIFLKHNNNWLFGRKQDIKMVKQCFFDRNKQTDC